MCRVAICSDRLVWTQAEADTEDTTHVSPLLVHLPRVLHVATDPARHALLLAWSPALSTDAAGGMDVGEVGGTAVFSCGAELDQFVSTLQQCGEIRTEIINSRQKYEELPHLS